MMHEDAGPGSQRKIGSPERISIGVVANLPEIRARVARLTRPGFASTARLFFALSAREIPVLASSVRQLEEARPTLTAPRCHSLPRSVGALALGENLALDLVGLPLDEAFAPLWALALPGAAAVVKLRDDPAVALLKACCDDAGVPLVDASSIVNPIELGSALSVAALVAAAIHAAAIA
jgi:hypothetical protein